MRKGKCPTLSRDSPSFARDKAAYNYFQRNVLRFEKFFSPCDAREIESLVFVHPFTGKRQIALRDADVNRIISWYYDVTKGEGSLKLCSRIAEHYAGISKKRIQEWLNSNEDHYKLDPKFRNKGPIAPVESRRPMGRHQVDLVDFSSSPSTASNGRTYRYVLGIIDVFSRFLILRRLESKHSDVVAAELSTCYSIIGKPGILQCDRGTEFRGSVDDYCKREKITIIRSTPYHPQSQGKVERSHGTWKRRFLRDSILSREKNAAFSWADNIQAYQDLYNGSHASLGKLSPAEVFFGRRLNVIGKSTTEKVASTESDESEHDRDGDDEDETDSDIEPSDDNGVSRSGSEALLHYKQAISTQKTASRASAKAAEKLKSFQPSYQMSTPYVAGDEVLVRLPSSSRRPKGNRTSLVQKGTILKKNVRGNSYLVSYICTTTQGKKARKTGNFNVRNITSRCRKDEKDRRERFQTSTFDKAGESGTLWSAARKQGCKASIPSDLINVLEGLDKIVFKPEHRGLRRQPTKRKGKKTSQDLRTLENNLMSIGLQPLDVGGGGDCLFLSLAHQYFGDKRKGDLMREIAAQYIKGHAHHYQDFLPNMSVDDYLNQISQPGVWGDHIDIHAIANALNVEIVIFESSIDHQVTLVSPDNPNEETQQLIIGHLGQYHYVSVEDLKSKTDGGRQEDGQELFKTATWGESTKDGLKLANSCPLDGPITFFAFLLNGIAAVSELLKNLAQKDLTIALLVHVVSLCNKNEWGDAKLTWLKETGQYDEVDRGTFVNCLGGESDRFFDIFAISSAASIEGVETWRCVNEHCPHPVTSFRRRTITVGYATT